MSTMSFLPPPPTLSHSVNSSGNFGMFVQNQTCPCDTCFNWRGGRLEDPLPTQTPESLTTLPPPPSIVDERAAETLLSFNLLEAIGRASHAQQQSNFDSIGLTRSATGPSQLGPTESIVSFWTPEPEASPTPAASPSFRMGAFSSYGVGIRPYTEPRPEPSTHTIRLDDEKFETLRQSLKDHIEHLTERQNQLDHSNCRSHDEMAAEDMEFDELDRKIMEIDEILSVLENA